MAKSNKILQRILSVFPGFPKQREASESSGARDAAGDYTDIFGAFTQALPMSIATVYACVKLLSESVATLPLRPLRRRDGVFVEDDTDNLGYLLNVAPNGWENAYDFKKRMVSEILLEGNAYIIPFRRHDDPRVIDHIVLADRYAVNHDTNNDTYVYERRRYQPWEIIHIKNLSNPLDPKRGVSVLSYAHQTLATASSGNAETEKRFIKGGAIRGMITNADQGTWGRGKISDEQTDKIARSVDQRLNEAGERIVSFPTDGKFIPFSMTSADLEFLSTRRFTVTEICRFFMVNPMFVFADSATNYKSAENASVDFLNKTLNPLLRSIETEFHAKLVGPSVWRKRRIAFDRSALHSCDLMTRVHWQSARLAAGLASPNELRLEDNMPALDGGDSLLVSANLKTMEQLLNEGTVPAHEGHTSNNDQPNEDEK
jgi:HK97 family phage portal protein